uniref:Coiled-coil domain-containing protein n=1 Tax=Steinernema glaseri TaxID=37863 RepID=A0A1I7YXN7_9BILA
MLPVRLRAKLACAVGCSFRSPPITGWHAQSDAPSDRRRSLVRFLSNVDSQPSKTQYEELLAQLKKTESSIHDLDLKMYEYERASHLRFWMLIAFGFGSFTALTYQLVTNRRKLLEATAKERLTSEAQKSKSPDPSIVQKLEELHRVERLLKILEDMVQHAQDNMLDSNISKLFKKYMSPEEWNYYVEKEIKKSSSADEFKKLLLCHVFDLQQEELRLTSEIKGWDKD